MENASPYVEKTIEIVMAHGPKLILALVVLFGGFKVINFFVSMADKLMKKQKVDMSLRTFLESLIAIILKTLVVISAASMIGVETTSFVAILGAAGLAVGLALQGSLANFAGGALILLFKPFKVHDLIEAQGQTGVVQKIEIFNTILLSPDNKTVIVPNGAISNGHIINYTQAGKIRVDLTIGIGYGADIKKAKEILLKVMKSHKKVLTKDEPTVNVAELADSSVNLAVRPWCKPEDYWTVHFDVLENAKEALDAANIEIPFPQRVVHMQK